MDARAITAALGGKWQGRYGLCRCPTHADSTPSLKVSDSDRRGIDVHCFAGCDWKEIKDELKRQGLLDGERGRYVTPLLKRAEPEPKKVDWSLWHRAVPLPGTLAEKYFVHYRKLKIGSLDLDHCLRFNRVHRMVVALMTEPVTNDPVGAAPTSMLRAASSTARCLVIKAWLGSHPMKM